MSAFPTGRPVSLRDARRVSKQALDETDRAREVLLNGVLPALKNADERVTALEGVVAAFLNQSFWGRLMWLVLGR
jgi:hypothetical protein